MTKLDNVIGKKSLIEMLAEPDSKNLEKNDNPHVESERIPVLTISADEYFDWQSQYKMIGVTNYNGKIGVYYNGFLCVGMHWTDCPEGTKAVVGIKKDKDGDWVGTALIKR